MKSSFEKKIMTVTFAYDCINLIQDKFFDNTQVKMVLKNKMGILIKMIGDDEDISDLLHQYINFKAYIPSFYVMNIEDIFDPSNLLFALHPVPDNFQNKVDKIDLLNVNKSDDTNNEKYTPKPIIFIRDKNKNMENEAGMKSGIYNFLEKVFIGKTTQIKNGKIINFTLHFTFYFFLQ